MSLGDVTKCDLSAGIAKVDYTALINTLRNSLSLLLYNIRKELDTYNDIIYNNGDLNCVIHSKTLSYKYTEMQKIAELLYTLKNANPFDTTEDKRTIEWVE